MQATTHGGRKREGEDEVASSSEEESSEEEIGDFEKEGYWWLQDPQKKKQKKKKRRDDGNTPEGPDQSKKEEEEEEEGDEEEEEREKVGGWLLELIVSMLQPGVNAETLKILNWVFVALFGCLLIMIIIGGRARFHAIILLFLSSGLFFSIQWYDNIDMFIIYQSYSAGIYRPGERSQ